MSIEAGNRGAETEASHAGEPGKPPATPGSALLVAGMHRSGTSALTRVLNLLGFRLADDLLPPNTDNETGFWESRSLVGWHDRALASMRLRWATPAGTDASWFGEPEAATLGRELDEFLRARFPGREPFAVKDPRLCRLLPVWRGVLDGWGVPCSVLIPLRHPVEVASSLKTRGNVPIESGLLLWLWYVLDAERGSRGLARSFLNYSDVLDDWRGVIARVGDDLGRAWPESIDAVAPQIDAFLRPDLRRQRYGGPVHGGALHGWVESAYGVLTAAARGGPLDTGTLDGIRAEVEGADELFGGAIRDAERMTFDAISGARYHAARVEELAGSPGNDADGAGEPRSDPGGDDLERRLRDGEAALGAMRARVRKLEAEAAHRLPGSDEHGAGRIAVIGHDEQPEAVGQAAPGLGSPRSIARKAASTVESFVPGIARGAKAMFDEAWYGRAYPDVRAVGRSRFAHYCAHGWKEGRWPNPLFDPAFYLAVNPDVAATGVEPLEHYLAHGWREGRDPNPLFSVSFYLSHYADIAASGTEPLTHYLTRGWKEGRRPHPLFDPAKARSTDPGGDTGAEPLGQYLHGGWQRGCRPCDEFDGAFYRAQAADLPADGDALAHYAGLGWRRGLDGARWLVGDELRVLCPEAGHGDPLAYVLRQHAGDLDRWRAPLGSDGGYCPDSSSRWERHGGAWTQDARTMAPHCAPPIGGLVRAGRSVEFTWIAPSGEAPSLSLACERVASGGGPVRLRAEFRARSGPAEGAVFGVEATRDAEQGSVTWHLERRAIAPGRRYTVRIGTADDQASDAVRLPGWTCDPSKHFAPATLVGRDSGRGLCARLLERFGSAADSPTVLLLGAHDGSNTARVAAWASGRFPGARLTALDLDDAARAMQAAKNADLVVFADDGHLPRHAADADSLPEALNGSGVCTIRVRLDAAESGELAVMDKAGGRASSGQVQTDRRCHFTAEVARSGAERWRSSLSTGDQGSVPAEITPASLHAAVWGTALPRVVIVTVLYRKERVVERFLRSVDRQGYAGPITVVMVDDRSPTNDQAAARAYWDAAAGDRPGGRDLKIVTNEENTGNCGSRNRGIAEADGDVYIVIDCDCLLNDGFVAAHIREHLMGDADVVCGPLNIEAGEQDPEEVVRQLEADPARVWAAAEPQDRLQPNGFVNCITRNVSISARFAGPAPLFDEDFAYSARPDSGFGWEDVEMGASLYKQGAKIVCIDDAFSVHCTHAPSGDEARLCRGSARNFVRLTEKHGDLPLIARRWMSETAGKIGAWARGSGAGDSADIERLDGLFERGRAVSASHVAQRDSGKRLRVLSYRWHAPHQYELYKLPHDFTLATQMGNGMVDVWSYDQRPMRSNARFLPMHAIDPSDYDVAILHFDENALAVDNCNGVLGHDWGEAFRRALEWDIPKVAICHGTPQFEGQYGLIRGHIPSFNVYETERRQLVDALRGVPVVCNSWQAFDEWGFEDARVIWHGFDPQEFPPGTQANQVLTHGPDPHRPHYRGQKIYDDVLARLDGIRVETARHPGAPLLRRTTNAYAVKNFRSYVDRIRSFTAYLNTTRRSPMPRSRGEAMMCGVIPVCLRNHDADHFIRHGVNGFVGETAIELSEYIKHLLASPVDARRIGEEARRTAMDVFNHDRFLSEWCDLLSRAVGTDTRGPSPRGGA